MPPWAVAVAVGVFALGLYARELTAPEYLSPYDSGVYLGGAIRLVSGLLPYRDFTLVEPSGVLILLSPWAWATRLFGSHVGFNLARAASAVVCAANVMLLAWLVRRWGRVAMAAAGVVFATSLVAVFSDASIRLEPYLVLFALAGAVAIIGPDLTFANLSTRRLVVAGVLFGLSAAVKLTGVLPLIVAAVCIAGYSRRRALTLLGIGLGTTALICAPFAAFAPRAFLTQALEAQLLRPRDPIEAMAPLARVANLTGQSWASLSPRGAWPVVALVAFALIVVAGYSRRVGADAADWYLLGTGVVIGGLLMVTPSASTYYFYYSLPFLIGALTIAIARLAPLAAPLAARLSSAARVGVAGALLASGLVVTYDLYWRAANFYSTQAWAYGIYGPWVDELDAWVPPGACVVYSSPLFGIYADRFVSNRPGCPTLVDPFGMWLPYRASPLAGSGPVPQLTATWRTMLGRAQYAVFSMYPGYFHSGEANVPWTPPLRAWFVAHYRLEHRGHYFLVYRHL